MTKRYFVTGTDTEVGKTVASCALLQAATQLGYQTVGYKPVASGSEMTTDGLRNSDALALQRNSSLPQPYSAINPYTFAEPTSPHIVSADEGRAIDAAVLSRGLTNAGGAGRLGVDRRGGRLVYTALCHADVCRLGTDGAGCR